MGEDVRGGDRGGRILEEVDGHQGQQRQGTIPPPLPRELVCLPVVAPERAGVPLPAQVEWEEKWWEASDWSGMRETGAEKSGCASDGESGPATSCLHPKGWADPMGDRDPRSR